MTHAQPDPEGGSSLTASVESATKLAGLVALITYAVGLIVVNTYLFGLGVSDFELLRPRFVTTGVIAVGMVVWSTAAVAAAGWCVVHVVFGPKETPLQFRALFLVGAAVMLFLPWGTFAGPLELGGDAAASAMLTCTILGWAGYVLYRGEQALANSDPGHTVSEPNPPQAAQEWTPDVPRWVFLLIVWPYAFAFGLACLLLFANKIYPTLPEQFGGGEARSVRLLIAKDAAPAVRDLDLPLAADSQLTSTVALVFTGNDFYVVRNEGKIVQIDDAAVTAIQADE